MFIPLGIATWGHVLGVILGIGFAFSGDILFLLSVRDKTITYKEIKILKQTGKLVWLSLIIIIFFGIALVLQAPDFFLNSHKFLAKMSIVIVIMLNGAFFHLVHIPKMIKHTNEHLPSSDEFMRKRSLLVASGAVSMVSWLSALVLGLWSTISYPYLTIMATYLVVLSVAICIALLLQKKIIPNDT